MDLVIQWFVAHQRLSWPLTRASIKPSRQDFSDDRQPAAPPWALRVWRVAGGSKWTWLPCRG